MTDRDLTEDDREHISRLRALRESGTHNMFMELKDGLVAHFGDEGHATYEWVTDNWEFYQSGDWVDDE